MAPRAVRCVIGLHKHMLDDPPHLCFVHFWASNDEVKPAEGLRAALAQINLIKA